MWSGLMTPHENPHKRPARNAPDWSRIDLGHAGRSLPKQLGRYEIHDRLGVGGMGVVLDASAPSGHRVALKLLRPAFDNEQRQMLRTRFLREARILHQLDHPGIVKLLDFGEISGMVYLAMEQVIGVTLNEVRRHTSLDLASLTSLAVQLADALAHMHQMGVVHRDIKPGNVMINQEGRAVLADFGIATNHEATGITQTGQVLGSAGYIAPECFRGQPPSRLSDQYALGRLLFEMGAHTRPPPLPLDAPILVQFSLRMKIDWSRFPSDPPWPTMAKLIERMVSEEPEHRFESPSSLREAFFEFESIRGSDAAPRRSGSSGLKSHTVFAEANTLNRFLARLNLQPKSPWDAEDSAPAERSLVIEPPGFVGPERPAPSEGRSASQPPRINRAPSPKRSAVLRSTMRSRPALFFVFAVLGAALSYFGAERYPGPARALYRTLWARPLFTYQGDSRPTQRELTLAQETLRNAREELRAGNAHTAQTLLGACIELSDLPVCHHRLAALLELTGHPSALTHAQKRGAAQGAQPARAP